MSERGYKGWEGVLPSPNPHCNKRHHTAEPTQNRVEGNYASTKAQITENQVNITGLMREVI